jgi:hypothetical protein
VSVKCLDTLFQRLVLFIEGAVNVEIRRVYQVTTKVAVKSQETIGPREPIICAMAL